MLDTRHANSMHAAESMAKTTFADLFPSDIGEVVALQKEFSAQTHLASCRYGSLHADLNDWRRQVNCGGLDFDSAREDDFKAALRAFIALADFLLKKFDAYSGKGLVLVKTRRVAFLHNHRESAQRLLDSWKSPEWETLNERVVDWNKEQGEYLRAKMAAHA